MKFYTKLVKYLKLHITYLFDINKKYTNSVWELPPAHPWGRYLQVGVHNKQFIYTTNKLNMQRAIKTHDKTINNGNLYRIHTTDFK